MLEELPEKQPNQNLLLAATVLVVVGYAWIASKVLEPKLLAPPTLVSETELIENSKTISWAEARDRHYFLLSRVTKDLARSQEVLDLLGGLPEPVQFTVHADEPNRYLVTDSEIELGHSVLQSRGQLTKALIKAWLLQRAATGVSGSLLRLEVVSDLLLAMTRGGFEVQVPGHASALKFDAVSSWLTSAASFEVICRSPWRSLELLPLCRQQVPAVEREITFVNELSYRPLLGAMIWGVYESLSVRERLVFLRSWVQALQGEVAVSEAPLPQTIEEMQAWIRDEFHFLLQSHAVASVAESESLHRALKLSAQWMMARAEVRPGQIVELDFLFRSQKATPGELNELALKVSGVVQKQKAYLDEGRVSVSVVETDDGVFTLPGLGRLTDSSAARVKSRVLVWESCKGPRLGQMMNHVSKPERVLYLNNCGPLFSASFDSLFYLGPKAFATANTSLPFMLLKTSAAQVAMKYSLVNPDAPATSLMMTEGAEEASTLSAYLGFDKAQWSQELRAFQVLGAIEAVELVRPLSSDF